MRRHGCTHVYVTLQITAVMGMGWGVIGPSTLEHTRPYSCTAVKLYAPTLLYGSYLCISYSCTPCPKKVPSWRASSIDERARVHQANNVPRARGPCHSTTTCVSALIESLTFRSARRAMVWHTYFQRDRAIQAMTSRTIRALPTLSLLGNARF